MTPVVDVTIQESTTLAASVPHLLGFHPSESLVCLWIRSGRLQVTQRADIPEVDRVDLHEYVGGFLDSAAMVSRDSFVALCFSSRRALAKETLGALAELEHAQCRGLVLVDGAKVDDLLADNGERWIDLRARDWAKRHFGNEASSTPQASRDRVVAQFDAEPSICEHLGELPRSGTDATSALDAMIQEDAYRVHAMKDVILRNAIAFIPGRDLVLQWCARLDLAQRRDLLGHVIRAVQGTPQLGTPRQRRAAANVAATACVVAWLCGDGVRANAALDRCLAEQPDHSLGLLLAAALAGGLPPQAFEQVLNTTGDLAH